LFYNTNVLAASGAINITGKAAGPLLADTAVSTFGYKAGTDVTSSTSNITLTDDSFSLTAGKGLQINTSGKLVVQSYGNDFTSMSLTDFGLSSNVTGLTVGKDLGATAHTDTVTMGTNTSIAGPISVYAGSINLGANWHCFVCV
jgi:hypothetical protein